MDEFFALEPGNAPWGDYGDTLWNGLVDVPEIRSKRSVAELSRTGPFVPPITHPSGQVIVDDNLRQLLENSDLTGFGFMPVRFDKLVRIDWHKWDSNSDEPRFYPDTGEPEDYILSGEHDASLEQEMPVLWALDVPSTNGLQVEGSFTFRANAHPGTDISREYYQFWVTSRMKDVLEGSAGDWVRFGKVDPR